MRDSFKNGSRFTPGKFSVGLVFLEANTSSNRNIRSMFLVLFGVGIITYFGLGDYSRVVYVENIRSLSSFPTAPDSVWMNFKPIMKRYWK